MNNSLPKRIFERDTEGWDALGYAIIEQAVEDYKALCKAGMICDGQCVAKWPWRRPGVPQLFIERYNSKAKTLSLLHWFQHGGLKNLLELLDSKMDEGAILYRLGMVRSARRDDGHQTTDDRPELD